ncbi:coiled-coil domain-containing protein, partial [Clostridioides difficile]|uniref:coiled-coil domain-containing protein n=1 Tax=Clostridioides difficile TaxID=1496 RepID=UPI002358BEEE
EKSKLQRGIDLEEKIEVLNNSIKELKKEIDIDNKEKEDLEKLIINLQNQVDSKYKKIQDNNKNVESLSISTDLKENIFETYNKEEELKKLSVEKEEKNKLLKEVSKRIEELKFKNIDVEKNKTSVNEKLKKLLDHQETLNRSCPGDNKIVSSEKEYLHNLKSRLENTKDYEKQINSIKDDLNKNEKSK